MAQMMAEFRIDDLSDLSAYLIDSSRRTTESAIADLPKGRWTSDLTCDGHDGDISLRATPTIAEDHIEVDFAGTGPCSPKGINVPLS